MSAHSDERYGVALQGFSEFERGTLASFFRLAAERLPCYVQVDRLDRSDFVIADADHDASRKAVMAADRTKDTVFVGAQAPQGAMAWLPRPIDPMHILRELDSLVEQRHSAPGDLQSAIEAVDRGGMTLAPADFGGGPEVLVVEDSAIARRFLQHRLQELGYGVHLAHDAEQAMAQLRAQRFSLVFLDVVLGEPGAVDGLAICQRIKHRPEFAEGGVPPKVIIVTGQSGETDKVRATLAGCDAFLGKPLMDEPLLQTLRTLDPGFAAREASLPASRG